MDMQCWVVTDNNCWWITLFEKWVSKTHQCMCAPSSGKGLLPYPDTLNPKLSSGGERVVGGRGWLPCKFNDFLYKHRFSLAPWIVFWDLQKAKYAILLTGTPALSRPIELFKQVWCDLVLSKVLSLEIPTSISDLRIFTHLFDMLCWFLLLL
jgi:hypothetical protein